MTSKQCPQCSQSVDVSSSRCPECGYGFFSNRYSSRTEEISDPAAPSANPLSALAVAGGAAAGIMVLLTIGYIVYPSIFAAQREAQVQTAVSQGDAAKAGISEKNRTAAKAALNAIGELESVTSVGTNYQQYTSALQGAKIKFDAAVRDLRPIDEAEFAIRSQLEDSMLCHVDAKDAWSEFVKDGDEYGFLSRGSAGTVGLFSSKYGFSTSSNGEYYRATVLQAIWSKASEKFKGAERQLK